MKLSVVIITKNEERNIGRCIQSVQSIADEILVLDSFSDDKTEEICLHLGARFEKQQFLGYIEQKQEAINRSKYDWILSLDADEALDEQLLNSIKALKASQPQHAVYQMPRLTLYCGKWIRHCGWYPDTKIRLWKKTEGKWGGKNPHDKVIIKEGNSIGKLKGDILHYSYYTLEEHILQINHFTNIAAQDAFDKGKKSNFIKLFISPSFVFFKKYFLQKGFLDGYYGYLVSRYSAWYTFMKYSKLKELWRREKVTAKR